MWPAAALPFFSSFTYIKMAQLHVQKKRNQLWWLWLIIILIIIAVAYYFLVMNNYVPDTFGIKNHVTALTVFTGNNYVV
jgi:hypothetical protein